MIADDYAPLPVLLLLAFVLALFVLPSPWGLVAVGAAFVVEVGEAWFWWWLSKRRRPSVGVETMIGESATVVQECRPLGQVRIRGELWQARCDAGADPGAEVLVESVDGLTLVVEPVRA
jgi:membrane protein implicated in regulation of membrane protease activity